MDARLVTLGTTAAIKLASLVGALLLTFGILVPNTAYAEQASTTVEVIAHESVDEEYLTRNFLRSIFTLRIRSWPNGDPVSIFVLSDDDTLHTAFSRQVLGTFPYVLRRAWDRTVFTGTGLVPRQVSNIAEMRRRVLSTPGAIGYVPSPEEDSLIDSAVTKLFDGGMAWEG